MKTSRAKPIDKLSATAHVNAAIDSHDPSKGVLFLDSFLGLDIAYLPMGATGSMIESCRIKFEVRDLFLNMNGVFHGGVIATILDISMGHLVHAALDAPITRGGATLELKTQYLRGLTSGPAVCEARFTRRGRRISFLESKLWGEDGELAASATATFLAPEVAA